MACSLPLYNGVIMHIKNLKDAIKTKTKNLRRNLKALTQLHCIKLTAGYIFVKETIMRLRKFVFYIPGILLKKANIILSRLRNSLMTLILASRVQNVEIHIRFDGINCIFLFSFCRENFGSFHSLAYKRGLFYSNDKVFKDIDDASKCNVRLFWKLIK